MDFLTNVKLPSRSIRLSLQSNVLLLGSCFSQHIGQRLTDSLPCGQCVANPFGVLYNPASVLMALQCLEMDDFPDDDAHYFQATDGWWHHWGCDTSLAAPTLSGAKQLVKEAWQKGRRMLEKRPVVIATWSTDRVFTLEGRVVANCHKEPASRFQEKHLEMAEIVSEWSQLANLLQPRGIQLLLTLSPYRYLKWGLSENAVAKARLRLAMDALEKNCANVFYFPAYEIVVDELRDYRFYEKDMLHPTTQAVDYVWEKFVGWSFDEELSTFSSEKAKILRDLLHRPLHPDTPASQRFLEQSEARKTNFMERWGKW